MSKIIENVEDLKLLVSKYQWLKDRVNELIMLYSSHDGIVNDEEINIEYSDDDLEVSFTTSNYCRGEHWDEHYTTVLPIAWIFLDEEELKKTIKEKKEEEEEIRRKQKELNEMIKKRAQEQKDREEYERLKAKFEK